MNLDKISKRPLLFVVCFYIPIVFLSVIINYFGKGFLLTSFNQDNEFLFDNIYTRLLSIISFFMIIFLCFYLAKTIFGVKEAVVSAVLIGVNCYSFYNIFYLNFDMLYVFSLSAMISVLALYYLKSSQKIKYQSFLFYFFLTISLFLECFLTSFILLSLLFVLYSFDKTYLKYFKSLKILWFVPITYIFFAVVSYFIYKYGNFNVLETKMYLGYESKLYTLPFYYIVSVFVFVSPLSFFIIPSIPFIKSLKSNIEFRFLIIWFLVCLVVLELSLYKSLSFLGILIVPLSILIGVAISNMALDSLKNYKINLITWILISLALSLFFISLFFKDNDWFKYVYILQSFIILNGIFIGCYNLLKSNIHKAFFSFVNAYYISFIIFCLLIF